VILGKLDHDIDYKVACGAIIGRYTGGKMKVGSLKRTLHATDPKHLCKRLKQRGFAGGIGAHNGGKFAREVHALWRRTEGSETCQCDRSNAHLLLVIAVVEALQLLPYRRGRLRGVTDVKWKKTASFCFRLLVGRAHDLHDRAAKDTRVCP
jgi:hypothetical protein